MIRHQDQDGYEDKKVRQHKHQQWHKMGGKTGQENDISGSDTTVLSIHSIYFNQIS